MSIQIVDNFVNTLVLTPEVAYAPSDNVVIEAFTAMNDSSVNAMYSVYIKSADGVLKPQIKNKVLVWGKNDLGIGVVNQTIPDGGELLVECTATNSIYFTVTGRVIK